MDIYPYRVYTIGVTARQAMPRSLATAANWLRGSRIGEVWLKGVSPSRWWRLIVVTAIVVWALALAGCESVSPLPAESPASRPRPATLALPYGAFAVNIEYPHDGAGSLSCSLPKAFSMAVWPDSSAIVLVALGAAALRSAGTGSLARPVVLAVRGPPTVPAVIAGGRDLLMRIGLSRR